MDRSHTELEIRYKVGLNTTLVYVLVVSHKLFHVHIDDLFNASSSIIDCSINSSCLIMIVYVDYIC